MTFSVLHTMRSSVISGKCPIRSFLVIATSRPVLLDLRGHPMSHKPRHQMQRLPKKTWKSIPLGRTSKNHGKNHGKSRRNSEKPTTSNQFPRFCHGIFRPIASFQPRLPRNQRMSPGPVAPARARPKHRPPLQCPQWRLRPRPGMWDTCIPPWLSGRTGDE